MAKDPSEEYVAFDKLMGKLLKVSKADLDAKIAAHKAHRAEHPRKAGRKKARVTGASSSAAHDAS